MGPLEQCDDGNVVNGDGCDSNCTLSRCGNGIVGPPEECDDGNFEDGDGCDPNCRAPRCNNGHWDYRSETCDDGTAARDDGCDTDCSPSRCGAGIPASVCGGRAPIRSIEGGQAILLEDGTIWAWGANLHGAAGQPHGGVLLTPVQMAGINHARKFCTTADWSLVLQDDGGVLAAGWNLDGQLGVFGISYRNTFAPVPDLPPIVDISCGSSPMALASDGTLWAWGGITLSSPIQVQGAPSIVALGTTEVLAVDGSVWHIDPQFFAATAAPVPALGAGSVLRLNGPFAVLSDGTVALARDGQVIVSSPPLADFSGSQAIGIDGAFYAVDNPTGQTWQLTATSFPAPIVEAGSFGSDLVRLADGSVWARGDVPGDGSYRSLTYVPIANFP
jgi:cysteine-rich repeat protein